MCTDLQNSYARTIRRRVTTLRLLAYIAVLTPILVWATLVATTGSIWLPGSGAYRYAAAFAAVLAAFYAFEDLSAVARHRSDDAAALASLDLPAGTAGAPRGADFAATIGDDLVLVTVVGTDVAPHPTHSGHLATPISRRRGVSPRRLCQAADRLSAEAVVVVPRCRDAEDVAVFPFGTVRIIGADQWAAAVHETQLAETTTPVTEELHSGPKRNAE